MTELVLLVLAVVWGVVLFSWLRSRARTTFGDPVGTFRRHLSVLEHTGPTSVRPANRLRVGATQSTGLSPLGGSRRPVGMARSASGLTRMGEPELAYAPARAASRPGPRPTSVVAQRRRQALKRRRDVLLMLVTGAAGSLLLGVVPGLHKMLLLQLVFDLLLAAYVSLLIRLRNLAAERDRKLAYLPRTPPGALTRAASARSATRVTPGRAAQMSSRRHSAGGFDRLSGYDPSRYGMAAN